MEAINNKFFTVALEHLIVNVSVCACLVVLIVHDPK